MKTSNGHEKKQSFAVRRWVHRLNSSAALILLFTGTMVTWPEIRTLIWGGQGKILSDIHMWTGLVFVSVPIIAFLIAGKSVVENLKKRIIYSNKTNWRRVHLSVTLLACCMMGLTGSIIWIDYLWILPTSILDACFLVHLSFAWIIGLTLPLHLWMARRGITRVTKKMFVPMGSLGMFNRLGNGPLRYVQIKLKSSVARLLIKRSC